MMTEFSFLNN